MNLKLLRMALCMSTETAARVLAARPDHPDGVSETTWKRWEAGKKELPPDMQEHLQKIEQNLQSTLGAVAEMPRQTEGGAGIAYHGGRMQSPDLAYHQQLAAAVWAYAIGVKIKDLDDE